MGSPMTQSHLNLSDLEKSKSGSLRFQSYISELSHMLPLNISRKPYMWSTMSLLHLILSDPESESQDRSDLEAFYLIKDSS